MGAAHQGCNLNRSLTVSMDVPIYCHNFSGYDSHLMLDGLSKLDDKLKISAMAYNTEKIRNLMIHGFTIHDSLSFLQAPLAELVNIMAKSSKNFKVLDQTGLSQTEEDKRLLLRKGG